MEIFWKGLILGSVVTMGMGIPIVGLCETTKGRIITFIITFIICVGSMCGVIKLETDEAITGWNNGYCSTCGTEWELKSVDHQKNGSTYYDYYCNTCGRVVSFKNAQIKETK